SDDLIMGAVSNMYNLTDSCEKALEAGNHLFLICKPEEVVTVFKKLLRRVERSDALQAIVYRNSSKILSFKFDSLQKEKKSISIPKEISRMKRYSEKASQSAITPIRGTAISSDFQSCTLFYPLTKWLSDDPSELRTFFQKRRLRVQMESFPIQIQ